MEGKWDITATGRNSCKLVLSLGVNFHKKTIFKSTFTSDRIVIIAIIPAPASCPLTTAQIRSPAPS